MIRLYARYGDTGGSVLNGDRATRSPALDVATLPVVQQEERKVSAAKRPKEGIGTQTTTQRRRHLREPD